MLETVLSVTLTVLSPNANFINGIGRAYTEANASVWKDETAAFRCCNNSGVAEIPT